MWRALFASVLVVVAAGCGNGHSSPNNCPVTHYPPSCVHVPEFDPHGINPANGKCELNCPCLTDCIQCDWDPCDGGVDGAGAAP